MERIDRCPLCKGRNLLKHDTYHEKNKIKDEMECTDCKSKWQNVYTFSHHFKIKQGVAWGI